MLWGAMAVAAAAVVMTMSGSDRLKRNGLAYLCAEQGAVIAVK